MIKTMINAWKVPDIRKKLLFTAFIIKINLRFPISTLDSGTVS